MRTIYCERGAHLVDVPREVLEGTLRGEVRIVAGDRVALGRPPAAELRAFEEARRVGYYTEVRRSSTDDMGRSLWFHWAASTRQPFVTIRKGRTHAKVRMDLVAFQPKLGEAARAAAERVIAGCGATEAHVHPVTVDVEGVPIERAPALADALRRLALDAA